MNVSDAQFLQMVNARRESGSVLCSLFCQCQELSTVFYARLSVYGEVTMVHFVNNSILLTCEERSTVVLPTLWICF